MRSEPFKGGWYADALPDGRFVVLYRDGSCLSSDGPIAAPTNGSGGCLYPRLDPSEPGVSFAGQAWQGFLFSSLVWSDGKWTVIHDGNAGVYGCIYLPDGTRAVNTGYAGSQGFRYVRPDNSIATGDDTYGPNPYDLMEWTALASDLIVGQGQNGGALVWDRGTLRVLVDPPAGVRFIHATATGQTDDDTFGLAFWGESGVPTTCYWGTLGELRALPVLTTPPTPIPPTPLPPTPPEVPMQFPSAEWSVVRQMHARFGAILPATDDGARTFTRMVCEQLAWSFTTGGWCWKSSSNGASGSKDCVARQTQGRFEGWDILIGAGVQGPRVLSESPSYYDLAGQWPISVVPTNHLGITPPPPTPVPVPPTPQPPAPGEPTIDDVYAAVVRLQASFDRVFR